jgi:carbon monoxide dehydrogenase subunit G
VARAEHTVVVERPPDEVFRFLTDLSNVTSWQSGAVEVRAPAGVEVGTTYVEVLKFLGRRFEATLEVTEYEPSRLFSVRTRSGPIPFQVSHALEPADTGESTRIHVELEGDPGGLFRLAEPLVMRNAQRQLEGDFATLKQLVEARGAADGGSAGSREDVSETQLP